MPVYQLIVTSSVEYVLQPHLIPLKHSTLKFPDPGCRLKHVETSKFTASTFPKADSLLEWLRRSFWFPPPTLHVPVSLCYTTAAGCPSTCPHTHCGARQIWLEWLSGRSCLVWKSSPQVVGHFCRCSSYFLTGNCGNYRQKPFSVSLLWSMGCV